MLTQSVWVDLFQIDLEFVTLSQRKLSRAKGRVWFTQLSVFMLFTFYTKLRYLNCSSQDEKLKELMIRNCCLKRASTIFFLSIIVPIVVIIRKWLARNGECCKTALVIVNSNTSLGHPGRRRESYRDGVVRMMMMVQWWWWWCYVDDIGDDDGRMTMTMIHFNSSLGHQGRHHLLWWKLSCWWWCCEAGDVVFLFLLEFLPGVSKAFGKPSPTK